MTSKFTHKKILITAGPTREYLDPVRYISNESTGKMGYAIAEALFACGADITLVSGPVSIHSSLPRAKIQNVKTANEMLAKCKDHFTTVDIAIFAAAVADYKPKSRSVCKIKKSSQNQTIALEQNPDIAFEFGQMKTNNQLSVGFALETNDLLKNAAKKLNKKRLDMIVINSPAPGEGFGFDTNRISILLKDGQTVNFLLKSKTDVAHDIITRIANFL